MHANKLLCYLGKYVEILILSLFGVAGVVLVLTPTKSILKIDHGIGRVKYKLAKTESSGLKAAGKFYNQIGYAFIFVAIAGLIIRYALS